MDIYKRSYNFSLMRIVAVKISLEEFIRSTRSFGAAAIYANSSILETLKTEFKSKTGSDLIFEERENDLSSNSKKLNKYFVFVQYA